MAEEVPPCGWDVEPVCSVEEWDGYSASLQAAALQYATTVMWAATGRQYGLCEIDVRPCRRACETCPAGWVGSVSGWQPYIFSGVWRNCWCGTGAGCSTCRAACQVWLPGPVASIVEVSIAGETVDPDTYSLQLADGVYWLVRLHTGDTTNECWPDLQNFDHPLGEDDTWSVTYLKGRAVPTVAINAAGTLAVEWARSCTGATCRLPSRIQNLTRQGISVSMASVDTLLDRGLTGLPDVDQVIVALNPHGLKGRPRLASVEVADHQRYVF